MKKGARIAIILVVGAGGILGTAYYKGLLNPEFWGRVTQRPAEPSDDPKVVAAAAKPFDADMITGPVAREDWTQMGGPYRTGVLSGKGLPKGWAKKAPRKTWTLELGPGYGGPAIDGAEAFILDRSEDSFDVLRCIDLASGEEKWSDKQTREGRLSYNGSRAVPAVTKEQVFAVGPFGDIYAYDRAQKKLSWKKDIDKDFRGRRPGFGISQSPLIHKGLVIVSVYAPDAGVVALDAKTGETRWQSPHIGKPAHPSPVLQSIHGVETIVALSPTAVVGIDPASGKEMWRYGGWKASNPIANPLVLPDGRIFLSAGYGSGSQMVVLTKEGEDYDSELAWQLPGRGTQIHQVMFYKNHLYANFNTNENLRRGPEGLVCIKLDGEVLWQTKKEFDINRGPSVMVDGVIISLSAEDGTVRFVEAKPEGFEVLAECQPFTKLKRKANNLFSPMALSGNSLLVRSDNELVRLELGG